MGRTLTDGTMPGQTERHLVRQDVARVWPTTIVGSSPPPQAGLGKTQTTRSPPGETIGLPKIDRMAQESTERQVRSKGTPHVGHADSVMNDEHGSQSDTSDWSSSNPITQFIEVTLPTPAISL